MSKAKTTTTPAPETSEEPTQKDVSQTLKTISWIGDMITSYWRIGVVVITLIGAGGLGLKQCTGAETAESVSTEQKSNEKLIQILVEQKQEQKEQHRELMDKLEKIKDNELIIVTKLGSLESRVGNGSNGTYIFSSKKPEDYNNLQMPKPTSIDKMPFPQMPNPTGIDKIDNK